MSLSYFARWSPLPLPHLLRAVILCAVAGFGTAPARGAYSGVEEIFMHTRSTRRWLPALALPLALASFAGAGCDLVTARAQETSEWHKTYTLDAKGRVDID